MNKKIIISIFIILIILTIFTLNAFATENSESEAQSEENISQSDSTSDTQEATENNVTYRPPSSNSGSSTVTSVSPVSSEYEANLGLNNILSILLASIGVLLILFSIAILIRIKN